MGKLDEFVPTIRELKTEGHVSCLQPLLPHIMYVDAPESSKLRIVVTDFKLSTWMTVKSVIQLEDMMSNIGIGGPWSEFFEYVITSINSRDTKIVFEGQPIADGPAYAKVVAGKYKGMPLVCFHLDKLVGGAAVEAIGNISRELFKAYERQHELLIKEQVNRYQLTKSVAAEQEKSKILQRDLDLIQHSENHKSQHMNERSTEDSLSMSTMQQSQGKMVELSFDTNHAIKWGHNPKWAHLGVPIQIGTPPPFLEKQDRQLKKRIGEDTGDSEASKKQKNIEDIQMIHSRDKKEVDTTLRLAIGDVFIHKSEHLSAKDVRINNLEKSLEKYKDAALSHQQQVADIQKKATDEIDLAKKENERLRKILYEAETMAKKKEESHASVLVQLQAKKDYLKSFSGVDFEYEGDEGHRAG